MADYEKSFRLENAVRGLHERYRSSTFQLRIPACCRLPISCLSLAALLCFGQTSERPKILRTVPAETKRDVNLERAIARELGEERFSYAYNRVSLSGGTPSNALVYISGPDYCGSGGCTLLVFASRNGGYRVVSRLTLIRAPVTVSSHRTNGWKDMIVFVSGGGIPQGYYALLRFDGKTYPENPTVPPAAPLREKASGIDYLGSADKAKFDIVSPGR